MVNLYALVNQIQLYIFFRPQATRTKRNLIDSWLLKAGTKIKSFDSFYYIKKIESFDRSCFLINFLTCFKFHYFFIIKIDRRPKIKFIFNQNRTRTDTSILYQKKILLLM